MLKVKIIVHKNKKILAKTFSKMNPNEIKNIQKQHMYLCVMKKEYESINMPLFIHFIMSLWDTT